MDQTSHHVRVCTCRAPTRGKWRIAQGCRSRPACGFVLLPMSTRASKSTTGRPNGHVYLPLNLDLKRNTVRRPAFSRHSSSWSSWSGSSRLVMIIWVIVDASTLTLFYEQYTPVSHGPLVLWLGLPSLPSKSININKLSVCDSNCISGHHPNSPEARLEC